MPNDDHPGARLQFILPTDPGIFARWQQAVQEARCYLARMRIQQQIDRLRDQGHDASMILVDPFTYESLASLAIIDDPTGSQDRGMWLYGLPVGLITLPASAARPAILAIVVPRAMIIEESPHAE